MGEPNAENGTSPVGPGVAAAGQRPLGALASVLGPPVALVGGWLLVVVGYSALLDGAAPPAVLALAGWVVLLLAFCGVGMRALRRYARRVLAPTFGADTARLRMGVRLGATPLLLALGGCGSLLLGALAVPELRPALGLGLVGTLSLALATAAYFAVAPRMARG